MTTAKSRKTLAKTALLVVIIAAGLLIAFPKAVFLSETRSSTCLYCRANRVDEKILWWNRAPKLKENSSSAYWRTQVDPKHKHIWWCEYYTRRYISGFRHGDCSNLRFMLYPETDVAILRSFKTPSERKAFAEYLFFFDGTETDADFEARQTAIIELRKAYDENPARRDWQKILKRLKVI